MTTMTIDWCLTTMTIDWYCYEQNSSGKHASTESFFEENWPTSSHLPRFPDEQWVESVLCANRSARSNKVPGIQARFADHVCCARTSNETDWNRRNLQDLRQLNSWSFLGESPARMGRPSCCWYQRLGPHDTTNAAFQWNKCYYHHDAMLWQHIGQMHCIFRQQVWLSSLVFANSAERKAPCMCSKPSRPLQRLSFPP